MWKVLRSDADWRAHRAAFATSSTVDWGNGPNRYPCLVDTIAVTPGRLLSAYVYPEDAAKLQAAVPTEKVVDYQQKVHSQAVSAHLLAIVHFLVETGICRREKYTEEYLKMLANVEQWAAEDSDGLLARIRSGSGQI